jgi:subtilisin-like proprotein convertase family protein
MAMGTGASGNSLRGPRGRNRLASGPGGIRRARTRRVELEALESRTLLSVLPPATVTGTPQNLTGLVDASKQGNADSPTVVVDPADPNKMVAVWVVNNPSLPAPGPFVNVEGAYSIDAGKDWLGFTAEVVLLDPATTNPTIPYADITNPTAAFDNAGHFYVLTLEHNAGFSSGAVALEKYDFTGDAPVRQSFSTPFSGGFGGSGGNVNVLYQWIGGDQANYPTLNVDSNPVGIYTDPVTGVQQSDPYSGNLYVAWGTTTIAPAFNPLGNQFNPNATVLLMSSDQGNSFSSQLPVNSAAYGPTIERDAQPQIIISEGRPAGESGRVGDPGVAPGTVTIAWADIASLASTDPTKNQSRLLDNTVSPGRNFPANQVLGLPSGLINFGTTTTFSQTVSIPANQVANVSSLTLGVAITDSSDANLGLVLIGPHGETYTVFAPQTVGGNTNQAAGISGTNIGINNGFAVGTVFNDKAARSIVDISATGGRGASAPYLGDYRPENDFFTNIGDPPPPGTSVTPPNGNIRTLTDFLNEVKANGGLNGTWKLETVDTNTSAPSSPNFVNLWSLNFSTGLQVGTQVDMSPYAVTPTQAVANSQYIPPNVLQGSGTQNFPTGAPSSPTGIGPNLVLAADNTLGSFSPHEGRIYAAFVGYYDIKVAGLQNPTSNTDVFLEYSDDGGRSWTFAGAVNNLSSQTDGYSESLADANSTDQVTGRSQYMPQIAVDQSTGTVVLSYRDAGYDASNARTATDVVTSIDGGNTWSPVTYANPQATAVDAITGKTVVIGPETDNQAGSNGQRDGTYGYGNQMGLAINNGKVYVAWAGNFNKAYISNGAVTGDPLNVWVQTMAIAAGPRIVDSTMGPIPLSASGLDGYQQAAQGQLSFTVQFDRPINPPNGGAYDSFTANDVQVFYHDAVKSTDAPVPLTVLSVAPIASSGVGPGNKFGFTRFTVTFSTAGLTNYTGTYSYLIAPDDGGGTRIVSPIASYVNTAAPQAPVTAASLQVPKPVPSVGTGGTGTSEDITTSTIVLAGHPNQTVTGVSVNLTLDHTRDGDLFIELIAPNGNTTVLYQNFGDTGRNFTNTTFSDSAATSIFSGTAPYSGSFQPANLLANLSGSSVDGTWTLRIDDYVPDNSGTLVNWSITVDSSKTAFQLQNGAPMDQNADGAGDQNAVTTSFTGTTPGDVYAVPRPQPGVSTTFAGAASILTPPFNQNTLPLIVSGPQVLSTSVPGGNGANLVTDGSVGAMNLTFDRPMQVATFTPADVLGIMGPTGSLTGPQFFPSDGIGLTIPAATAAGSGTLDSTLTVPDSGGTFKIQNITVQLNAAFPKDSALTAVLVAPDGTQIPLFSGVGGTGKNFVNTVFDDSAANSITQGTAPFTGAFRPAYGLSSPTLTGLQGKAADGTWHLRLTNTQTGATGTLDSWSLRLTPVVSVTAVNPQTATVNGNPVQVATTFTVGFPRQYLSGTYTLQIGPGIQDEFGDTVDTTQNAGVDVLRGQSQNGPTSTAIYNAPGLPVAIPAPAAAAPGNPGTTGTVSSTITVPDSFPVQGDNTSAGVSGLRVQLDITYPNDPDLSATLYYDYGGPSQLGVPLFSNVGSGKGGANFSHTIFDDRAGTPIQSGGAPFFATFNPQLPLSAFVGLNAKGTWTLVITNSSTGSGKTGTLNSWSLTFQKPLPTSGLGEPNSDNINTSFRIFDLGQTDALAGQQWTAVGPASIGGGSSAIGGGAESSSGARSGRVGGLAIDPSDPTGNTVYVAGASGGIWKTTDFLTTDPAGPTYIPLTNFGPTFGVNIGSLTVLGRNNDTNQSIIIAATGEGDTASPGVGFLISSDGGRTWTLEDSTVNVDSAGNTLPIASTARDRTFVGTTAFKVTVDPQLTPSGQAIIYAALSGTNGGVWRSEDTGKTWTNMLPGQATDVVLDPNSGTALNPDTDTQVQGNLQVVYAGIRGQGVYMSPNQGQVWSQMLGTTGNPLIDDTHTGNNVNPANNGTPGGAQGRIVLAVPQPSGNAAADAVYEGWLYAIVATPAGALDGIFVTKDFGQNWTKVRIPTLPPEASGGTTFNQAIPSNNISQPDYPLIGSTRFPQGNYNILLTVDPTNPNVIYAGGTADGNESALIRIDLTAIWDAHNLTPYSDVANDGGALDLASKGPAPVDDNTLTPYFLRTQGFFTSLDTTPYLNFIRDPSNPFNSNSTLRVFDYASFSNNGAGVEWIPFDAGGTDYHKVTTMIDPTTGLPRIVLGNDQGVWSILDNNGTFETRIGNSDQLAGTDRNGNLQITQFYYGAAQPSSAAAQIAGALFYGSAQDDGGPVSAPGLVGNGNITWSGPGGDAGGVGTDQQGHGTAYQYFWPCCGGGNTDFFQFIPAGQSGNSIAYLGRTNGLLQASGGEPTPDPQWPFTGVANFAVNPVNGQDVVITSDVGRIFTTPDAGVHWFDVGDPGVFGSPGAFSNALAYGAPDPGAPQGVGNLGNFIYVGTATGQVYITQVGGGSGTSNNWLNASLGLDGSTIQQIITDPTRSTHDAYAVTSNGVFYIKDSVLLANNPTNAAFAWQNITGNIHQLAYSIFGQSYDPTTDPNSSKYNQARGLTSILADWRYSIPNNPANPGAGYHPVLYVGSNSGVYQSLDNGKTWALFPQTTFGAVAPGGNLPHVGVTSLSSSLGNIDVNTGMPNTAGPYDPSGPGAAPDPDLLMAATYGQGEFAINLAPMLFPSSVAVAAANTAGTAAEGTTIVTTAKPVINGLSEITQFGNATWVTIVDETPGDPTFGQIIGGFDPSQPIAVGTGNATDALGNFAIPVTKAFGSNGLKTIKVYTTDDAGSRSNPVTLKFTLQATDIVVPPPTTPPSAPTIALASPTHTVGGVPVTNLTAPLFSGTTLVGTSITVTETWQGAPAGTQPITVTVPASAVNSDGTFSFTFQDFTDPAAGGPVESGTFLVSATATYSKYPGLGASVPSNVVTFQIDNTTPAAVTDLRLSPTAANDTGIVGDHVTSQRQPVFIGTTTAGNIVELFVNGQPAIQATATASSTTSTDANGAHYNFSIQLPYSLTNGQISLYVEVINAAGNTSGASNSTGLAIASTAADYNGGPPSDPALFARNTSTNQVQWLVQTPAGSPPPWFGASGVLYAALPAAKAPANAVVPFEGDFDGDGVTDLAYYNIAAATWTLIESSNSAVQGPTTFALGTPNSSLPVVGHFDPNGPSEEAVFTVNAQGQGIWSIASVLSGTRTFAFGQAGDIPLAGAFDALGYDEPALYRPGTGQFLVLNPTTHNTETLSIPGLSSSPDLSSLVPVPGQYDNLTYFQQAAGATPPIFGHTEPAVYDPKTGVFTILGPNGPYTVSGFQPGDIPAPADYLNLGSDQVAAFRPSAGQLIVRGPNGQLNPQATLGQSGDIPVTAPLAYRVPSSSTLIPTPTPTTPTPTPTTPTPTPTAAPLVTVSNVQFVTKRHKVKEILITFSGAVNGAEALNTGIYQLIMAGKHGSFTARNARSIRIGSASFAAASNTVALFPRKPFVLHKPVELVVNGAPPMGLQDGHGRLIDGDRNGQPGGNAVAVLSRGGVSMTATAAGPGGVNALTVDALLELNALAAVTAPRRPGRDPR